jgi:hypothetical protein
MMVTGPIHTYSLYLTSIYLHVYYIMMQNFANDVQYGNKLDQCVDFVRKYYYFIYFTFNTYENHTAYNGTYSNS